MVKPTPAPAPSRPRAILPMAHFLKPHRELIRISGSPLGTFPRTPQWKSQPRVRLTLPRFPNTTPGSYHEYPYSLEACLYVRRRMGIRRRQART